MTLKERITPHSTLDPAVQILLRASLEALHEKKAHNIVVLDVRGVSPITDYLIIAEGRVEQHVKALAREAEQALSRQGYALSCMEGISEGAWVVLDSGPVMVHLFLPELRERYELDRLWGKAIHIPTSSLLNAS